ncbi:GNAT family N-acetyltransferase [Evansella sp. AB-rgal1]|uniref:GNAT family N-acetyltransferase n=1 Tax=Evansella sp. AB-rgal1 TaxID=3242696 RepID=UPI00359D2A29
MDLQSERLRIIPCTKDLVANVADRYKIGPHIPLYLAQLQEDPSQLGWGVWFVIEKETNQLIGDIGFKGKPDMEGTVEVGYGFIPSAQKKGYATEAVHEIIQWAFTSEEVQKVIAECYHDNFPSIRVLEKLNMKNVEIEENLLKWELRKSC